jgi:hypothetical protein
LPNVTEAAQAPVHVASLVCAVEPARALRFMADGLALGRWALGSMETVRVAPGLYRGRSLFDGSSVLVRPVLDPQRAQVDYWVGHDREHLSARIMAKVLPHAQGCVVCLMAWRSPDMSDARWARLIACHEAEIHLIQSILETPRRSLRRSSQ